MDEREDETPGTLIRVSLDTSRAAQLCAERGLHLPALMILYAGIDAMAWAGRPRGSPDVTRQNFIDWCERYLLPGTELGCNGADLYGARCSILHSSTPESRMSRGGDARELFYAWGTNSDEDLQADIRVVNPAATTIAVHIDDLLEAFAKGCNRFFAAARNHAELLCLLRERSRKMFKGYGRQSGGSAA